MRDEVDALMLLRKIHTPQIKQGDKELNLKRDCVLSKVKLSRLASVCTLECASPAEQVGFRLIVARVQW